VPVWAVADDVTAFHGGRNGSCLDRGGGDEVGRRAICCCRAGERLSSEKSFNSFLARARLGFPSGPVFKPAFISSRDPAKWPGVAVFLGAAQALGRAAAGTFYFSMQENQGGAKRSADSGFGPTLTFSAGMRSGMSLGRGSLAWSNEDTRPSR